MVRRRWWGLAAAVTVVVALMVPACEEIVPLDPSLVAVVLTSVGTDTNGLAVDGADVVVTAPATNQSGGTRIAFWRGSDHAGPDQQPCATWSNPTHLGEQEGAALRVRTTSDGTTSRTTAITITKNVWGGNFGVFNVHLWDTALPGDPFTLIAQFDLQSTFGTFGMGEPLPWRMCAQVVGVVLRFLVWPTRIGQPSWDDARYGGRVVLPRDAPTGGVAGFYAGHVQPGTEMRLSDLSVTPVPADAVPAPRPSDAAASASASSASGSSASASSIPGPFPSAPVGHGGLAP
jgi:hypothetical protein